MNKILASAALGAVLLMPSAAFALDDLNAFFLGGQTIDPVAMTCAEFNAASPELQVLVSSWFDGDATMDDRADLHYSRSDVQDILSKFRQGCAGAPNTPLAELDFSYGGSASDYINVTCDFFNDISDVNEAGSLLAWVIGYFGYTLDDTSLDGAALISLGNEAIAACAANPQDQLAKYVYLNLNLGTADEFAGNYDWDEDWDYDWDENWDYGHADIQFTVPDYYYEKNIAN